LVMMFGLTNALVTFQMMMNKIFMDLITEGKIVIYLDNILIFSKDLEEYCHVTQIMLEWLHKHKLFLKHKQCEFENK
jgi:hypothetical protein